MKKLLLGTAMSVALAASASAADMYVKAPLYNWTGFYVGGNVGYSWGNSNTTVDFYDSVTGALLASTNGSFGMDGVVGGGQAGYNWQTGKWVWGLEADLQASGHQGSATFACGAACPLPGTTATIDEKLEWFGTARARLGYTVTPTVLVYATGGLAYGEISMNGLGSPTPNTLSVSTLRAGWTVGGGIEAALGRGWTGKIEYLYMDLGSVYGNDAVAPPPPPVHPTGFSAGSGITDNILRVGANYRF
ncbi:MAG: outer membrane protein [Xanthobacteraceae bacterium]